MKKSLYDNEYHNGNDFDPHMDFLQFLKEARQHASDLSRDRVKRETTKSDEEKKSKKSWKNSLVSWWKVYKKSKPPAEAASNSGVSNRRRGSAASASGPIHESRGQAVPTRQLRRPISGPLTGLFNPARRGENEIPYTCLDPLNCQNTVQAYGPLYLVT